MKLKSYVFAALALSIMSGCSEDEITNNGTDGNQTEADNTAYVSVKINLPAGTSATRALTEEFDNGTAEEWKVNDVTLLFFAEGGAATEDGYVIRNIASTLEGINTVKEGLKLPDDAWSNVNGNGNEITVTSAQTNVIGVDNDVCAVAALINISSEASIAKENLRVGKTFGDINTVLSLKVEDVTDKANGFLMTSSPWLNSLQPATAFNLAPCTPLATVEAAEKNAASVKVERIVSKVELLESATVSAELVSDISSLQEMASGWHRLGTAEDNYQMAYKVEDGLHAGDIIVIQGWTLDVTNKKSFPFRKVDVETWSGGDRTIWELISTNNRMYFAIDPNYNGIGYTTESDFNTINAGSPFSTKLSPASIADKPVPTDVTRYPRYCLENTFDTDNQTKEQTTRLVIKAKYYPNNNNAANTSDTDGTWFALNQRTAHYSLANLKTEIIKIANEENIFADNNADITLTEGIDCQVSKVVVNGTALADDELAKLNAHLEIVRYSEGICYYPVRIRHFSDAEVYTTAGETYSLPYTAKELGRYGVVRNNSYRVQINKISQPGEPDIPPTPDDEPDDDQNLYISCTIDILAWALRPVQNEDL